MIPPQRSPPWPPIWKQLFRSHSLPHSRACARVCVKSCSSFFLKSQSQTIFFSCFSPYSLSLHLDLNFKRAELCILFTHRCLCLKQRLARVGSQNKHLFSEKVNIILHDFPILHSLRHLILLKVTSNFQMQSQKHELNTIVFEELRQFFK